jgi:putative hydrolase of the HAD superfamily
MVSKSTEAVLLDAMGTLIALSQPVEQLRKLLSERLAVDVDLPTAQVAIAAEIAYYREHHDDGRDQATLSELWRECAAVVRAALDMPQVDLTVLTELLRDSLRLEPFPDVFPTLRALRTRGLRLVVVSNWDISLYQVLARTGLAAQLDGAIASAELQAKKPQAAIFARGLELAGVDSDRAVHVGDLYEHDVIGARALGITPILLARDGRPGPSDVRTITSLSELPELLAG